MRNVSSDEAGDQARLDALLTDVDPALLASLKADERRRRRKLLLFAISGGLVMGSAIAITLMLLLNGNAVSAKDADRSLSLSNEGWAAWQQQDLPRATGKFKEAVAVDPRNANAWNGLGWVQLNGGGDAAEAQKAFEKCVAIEKSHPAALNGLGVIAFNRKEFDKAQKYWLSAAKDAPAAQFGLARLYLLQGKWDDAERYAKGLAGNPDDDGTAKRLLAAARAKRVDAELRKVIEPPPQGGDDSAARAWALFNQGKLNQAKELFEAAVKRDATDMNAKNGLGFVYLNLGKPAEAKPLFEACVKADPNAMGALNGLARCLKAEGKVDEAIRLWEKVAKQAPQPNAGTSGLAWTYLEQKSYAKALPYFEELARATPGDAEVQKGLQTARENAGK